LLVKINRIRNYFESDFAEFIFSSAYKAVNLETLTNVRFSSKKR